MKGPRIKERMFTTSGIFKPCEMLHKPPWAGTVLSVDLQIHDSQF